MLHGAEIMNYFLDARRGAQLHHRVRRTRQTIQVRRVEMRRAPQSRVFAASHTLASDRPRLVVLVLDARRARAAERVLSAGLCGLRRANTGVTRFLGARRGVRLLLPRRASRTTPSPRVETSAAGPSRGTRRSAGSSCPWIIRGKWRLCGATASASRASSRRRAASRPSACCSRRGPRIRGTA